LLEQNEIAVSVRGLEKKYKNGTEAIRGVDFTARRGESVAVLGPNGAGKTTFLRQLTTELKPTRGEIKIFGVDAVRESAKAKSLMGVTPQEAGVFETLTVRQHLELFGRIKGLSQTESRVQTTEIIENLELKNEIKKRVGELSGGQRRRVLIGLALLGKPPLLILDEPTTGLDPLSRRAVWQQLKKIFTEGATVILSTHYLEEAEFLCRRIAFINAGKIVADGSLQELQARFPQKHRLSFAEKVFGEPQIVYFDSFADAQKYIAGKQIKEYQISTSSLEDVYFSLVGERITNGKNN
jgi:ABC-type multidrug transport system ATPase subunit